MAFLQPDLNAIAKAKLEPTGFVDPANVDVAYDKTNRQFTLTHASGFIYYFYKGERKVLTSPWTSTSHENTTGSYYWLTIDANGAAAWTKDSFPGFDNGVFVAYANFGATDKFSIRENHGLMDWETWRNLHNNVGTYRSSGGLVTAGSYALNTNSVDAVTPAVDAAVVIDEDLQSTITALTNGSTYTRLHFDNGVAVFTTGSTFPYPDDGADIQYNQNPITGTALTSMGVSNRWVNMYVVFVPTTSDADSLAYRHVVVTGQQIYTTAAAAQSEDFRTLHLGNLGALFTEFVPYIRLTYKRTVSNLTRNAQFDVDPTYLVGNKQNLVSVSGVAPTNHNSLAGRTDAGSHPAAAIAPDTTNFNRILSSADDTVQKALDTLDNMDTASNRLVVTQSSHGFAAGDVVYYTGSAYAKAKADAAATSEVVGVVQSSIDTDNFWLFTDGRVTGLSGLTAGSVYYLSAGTAGLLTATEPTTLGEISKPVLIADSTTSGYIVNMRGVVVGGTNARTVVSLNDGGAGAKTIQDVAAYDAGELSGWVYIDATTDVRFAINITFAKNGDATYDVDFTTPSGDSAPSGFAVAMSGSNIQITTATSGITGFASASINFSLNAPAVGATFPLSIESSKVIAVGGTPASGFLGYSQSNSQFYTFSATSGHKYIGPAFSLPKGKYILSVSVQTTATATANVNSARLSTNTSDNDTGTVGLVASVITPDVASVSGSAICSAVSVIDVDATTQYYFKAYIEDSDTKNITAYATAVCIA